MNNFVSIIIFLLLNALSFTTALAYNSFVQSLLDKYNPIKDRKNVQSQAFYALSVTILFVFIVYIITKYNPKFDLKKLTSNVPLN